MDDRNIPSPSSSTSVVATSRRHVADEDTATCGCTCKSCCAAVIADCVAVCCCPCAVVNILALVLVKLPYAVARKCITHRKRKEKKKKSSREDVNGISKKTGAEEVITISEKDFSAEFKAEDVWLELCNVGHLGFGRVSYSGSPSNHGN